MNPKNVDLRLGDCLSVLPALPENSADAVVADPPSGIAFMGKSWDDFKGADGTPRGNFIAWMTSVMKEVYRVLKPGGHCLIWSLPRTSHWTAMGIEDAGFEIRDSIAHIFGQGFPKSLDVSKAIDRSAGADRMVVGSTKGKGGENLNKLSRNGGNDGDSAKGCGAYGQGAKQVTIDVPVTVPATPAAMEWNGWGTSLKPGREDWILCRKPLVGTVAANVLEWGVGGINIDGCRIGDAGVGRFPANIVFSHSPGCRCVGTKKVAGDGRGDPGGVRPSGFGNVGSESGDGKPAARVYGDPDGTETVEAWECVEGCPILALDRQSGITKSGKMKAGQMRVASKGLGGYGDGFPDTASANGTPGDQGGASRFFKVFAPDPEDGFVYAGKASTRDRNEGCGELSKKNHHPTVKSQALMSYLVRLVTPPGGTVLDFCAGSGSTVVAAINGGWKVIAIEREAEYFEIIKSRAEHAIRKRRDEAPLFSQAA